MARTRERDMREIAHGCVKTALAKGASQVGVRAYRVRDVSVQWRDGKLEQINESTTRGVGLQLYVDGRYSAAQPLHRIQCADNDKDAIQENSIVIIDLFFCGKY